MSLLNTKVCTQAHTGDTHVYTSELQQQLFGSGVSVYEAHTRHEIKEETHCYQGTKNTFLLQQVHHL